MARDLRRLFLSSLLALTASLQLANAEIAKTLQGIDIFRSGPSESGITIRYYGVTTMLISDGASDIVIDGYFSRPSPIPGSRRYRPIPRLIDTVLGGDYGFGDGVCTLTDPAHAGSAPPGRATRPTVVIPLHAHYDHALDSPIVAARLGATLVADYAVRDIARATQAYFDAGIPARESPACKEALDLSRAKVMALEDVVDAGIKVGRFDIELIRTPHIRTVVHRLGGSQKTWEPIKFATRIFGIRPRKPENPGRYWANNVALKISHGVHTMLIVPSAGELSGEFAKVEADVVFLSTGGLQTKNEKYQSAYWRHAMGSKAPKRVFLVHWENDRKGFLEVDGHFEMLNFPPVGRMLKNFVDWSDHVGAKLYFPPPIEPFDPFVGLGTH